MTTKQLRELIIMLRKEKITYTHLSAGGIVIDGVIDGKIEREATKTEPVARESMYERYGAELLKQPAAKPNELVPEEALLE